MDDMPSYLDATRPGRHTPLAYLLGGSLILFFWLGVGIAATVLLLILFAIGQEAEVNDLFQLATDPSQLGQIPYYLVLNISFITLFLGIWVAVRLVHQRSLRSVVTARPAVCWKRVWTGFWLWAGLALLGSLLEYLIWPESYSFQLNWKGFLPFALLAVLITPIQTSSEELLFRGYLVQAGSLFSRNRLFLSLLSGGLFALPHFANPEVAQDFWLVMLSYFTLGAFLAWISLLDGTLELALGLHAANNLFVALGVTYPDSALQTPALFLTTHFDPLFSLISLVASLAIFYLILFVWQRRSLA